MREMCPPEISKQDKETGSKDETAESNVKSPLPQIPKLEAGFQELSFLCVDIPLTLTDFSQLAFCRGIQMEILGEEDQEDH